MVSGKPTIANSRRRILPQTQGNAMQVRMELQADCFAGVWAFHANRSHALLEQGDVEAALKAATAIGDDTLQKHAGGRWRIASRQRG